MKSEDTEPMTFDPGSMKLMLQLLGQECHPLMYIRELTQNAIEALATLIEWNIDDDGETRKLRLIDNGHGMDKQELCLAVNQLGRSIGKTQSAQGNFGIGAKITALAKNPSGVTYYSWKNGDGFAAHVWLDPVNGSPGLRRIEYAGKMTTTPPVADDVMPPAIASSGHGTMVVLNGETEEDDTSVSKDAGNATRWVLQYLNSRYLSFPSGVEVWAPVARSNEISRERVYGMSHYLFEKQIAMGEVQLTDARANWWLLEPSLPRGAGGLWPAKGFVASCHGGELYDLTSGSEAVQRARSFGITFGYNRIVVVVTPDPATTSCNSSRMRLFHDGQPLPWDAWGEEFARSMPPALRQFIDEMAGDSGSQDEARAEARKRVMQMLSEYDVGNYKPNAKGTEHMDAGLGAPGGEGVGFDGHADAAGVAAKGKPRTRGDRFSRHVKPEGPPASKTAPDLPTVVWVKEEADPVLADRAATYLPKQHAIHVNRDFRFFKLVASKFIEEYGAAAGAETAIWALVETWFGQMLQETVMFTLRLRDEGRGGKWDDKALQLALSEEALTASVMQPYHVGRSVRQGLSSKFQGSPALKKP